MSAGPVSIGSEVDLVLRRYAYERGAPVYGYKCAVRPVDTAAETTDATEEA